MKAVVIALCLMLTCTVLAQNDKAAVRNIVLVHGAWADGSGWKGVYDTFVKHGYNVSIVQEPETLVQRPNQTDFLTRRIARVQRVTGTNNHQTRSNHTVNASMPKPS
jgi:hypothetical protein